MHILIVSSNLNHPDQSDRTSQANLLMGHITVNCFLVFWHLNLDFCLWNLTGLACADTLHPLRS